MITASKGLAVLASPFFERQKDFSTILSTLLIDFEARKLINSAFIL